MKIYKEINLNEFEFWGGAISTVRLLTKEELEELQNYIEELELEGNIWTETDVNDFFWFETDWIAIFLGYKDFETLFEERKHK